MLCGFKIYAKTLKYLSAVGSIFGHFYGAHYSGNNGISIKKPNLPAVVNVPKSPVNEAKRNEV